MIFRSGTVTNARAESAVSTDFGGEGGKSRSCRDSEKNVKQVESHFGTAVDDVDICWYLMAAELWKNVIV